MGTRFLNFTFFIILFSLCFSSYGQSRYWVAGTTSDWNNSANWSLSSGGAGGASVPGVGDTVIFDGNGLGRCNINIDIDVEAFLVEAAYSDSIVQQSGNTVRVGPREAVFSGGTFIGGDARITFEDPVRIDGTNFIATTDTIHFRNDLTLSGTGSFDANGSVAEAPFGLNFFGGFVFSKLLFEPTGNRTYTMNAGDTIRIEDSLIYAGNSRIRVNTGVIRNEGDLLLNSTAVNCDGNGTILLAGGAKQQVISTVSVAQSELPSVVIDKSADTLFFDGFVSIEGDNWSYVNGITNFERDSGVLAITQPNTLMSGSMEIPDLIIDHQGDGDLDLNAGDTITVSNQLTIAGIRDIDIDGAGVIHLTGDMLIDNTNPGHNGNATIIIGGSNNQLENSNVGPGESELPNIVVNKTGGTVTFSDTISLFRSWQYIAGNTDFETNQATIYVGRNNVFFSGNENFFNLVLDPNADVDVSDSSSIHGDFVMEGTGDIDVDGVTGAFLLLGDVFLNNSNTGHNGTATLIFSGDSNQVVSTTAREGENELPNVVINKTGGTITFLIRFTSSQLVLPARQL